MIDPWFDPNLYGWIPGTLLGVVGGTLGAVTGTLAPRGKAQRLVLGLYMAVIVACACLLAVGLVALLTGQPYGVWYGLGFPGLLGVIIVGALFPVVRQRYREAEARRLAAGDLA
jgi:CHASE2 domain-containing sensor protein